MMSSYYTTARFKYRYSHFRLLQRVIVWLIVIFLLTSNKPVTISVAKTKNVRGPSSPARTNHLACVKDVLQYLPLGRGYRRKSRNPLQKAMMYPNHYDARTGLWNGDERLANLSVPSNNESDGDCNIWEVGAFKNARDSLDMMPKYPHCKFHAFEPVPPFYQELEHNFLDNPQMDTHNYGLGKKSITFRLDPSILRGEGTFLKNSDRGTMEAKIESFDYAIQDCGGKSPSVLQMNCEGCEWILIPEAIESNFIERVPIIQIATHNYPIRENETE